MWRTRRMWIVFSNILDFAVIFVVVLGVINTMLMSVTERTREIGTMMAIGTSQKEVIILFLLEGLVLGIIGGLIGSLAGGGLVQYFSTHGLINLKGSSASGLQATIGETVYAKFSWIDIIISFIAAQIVAVFSSFYPAYIASRQEPVEALRHI